MTETESDRRRDDPGRDDGLIRRAAHAQRDASLRFTGGNTLDEGQQFAMEQMHDVLDARRVFFATWSDNCYVGRSIVGATDAQARSFRREALPTLPSDATSGDDVIRVVRVDALTTTNTRLAEIADADEVILAVATWAARHPTCVIGITGVDPSDEDVVFVIESFLLMLMGATIAERLLRQRNRAELRRGEAFDTLVDELDDERRRISHEIHDGVLQNVSSIAHFLETLSSTAETEASRTILGRLRHEAQNSAITLRRIVNEFEPDLRDEEPMSIQIAALTQRFADFFDLGIAVDVEPAVDESPPNRAALRVLRQALDNVVTHAEATAVHVRASTDADGQLTVTVDDDGIGIDDHHPWEFGVGLRSMTRVLEQHGGHLRVDPAPTSGTRLSMAFPINGGRPASLTAASPPTGPDHAATDAIRTATLSLLDEGRRPSFASVADITGLRRRDLLARHMSAASMIADAVDSLVDSIEARWAAFGPIDQSTPFDARLTELLDRRFTMEVWGRPIRQHTLDVDPSKRFDDEVATAFQPELSRLDPMTRDDTGRLVGWLLRPRTIRAIISGVAVDPHVARSTIRSVARDLLDPER